VGRKSLISGFASIIFLLVGLAVSSILILMGLTRSSENITGVKDAIQKIQEIKKGQLPTGIPESLLPSPTSTQNTQTSPNPTNQSTGTSVATPTPTDTSSPTPTPPPTKTPTPTPKPGGGNNPGGGNGSFVGG